MMNRFAIYRYVIIDRCLANHAEPMTKVEITERVNECLHDKGLGEVTLRTITKDLADLRERLFFDAPIKMIRDSTNAVRYRYGIPNYSIFTVNKI